MRMKNLLSALKKPRTRMMASLFFMMTLLPLKYTFAQDTTNGAPAPVNSVSTTQENTSPLDLSLITAIEEVAKQVIELEEKLAEHQLLVTRAKRDLERMRMSYAAQKRKQDTQRVQDVMGLLDRELHFSEQISFQCSTNMSLSACLTDYIIDPRVQSWVQKNYQSVLSDALAGKVDTVALNPDWYAMQVNLNFNDLNMGIDGLVTASIEVHANITSQKIMACALLNAPADLCEVKLFALNVRSNKYDDEVYINNKPYGSTPLALMLDPGVYSIQIKSQGVTQERTLTLDQDIKLNFAF